jgi:hypothetical protein
MAEAIDTMQDRLPFSILTDLPAPEEWHKRVRKGCAKLRVLDDILSMIEQRFVPNEHGKKIKLAATDITVEQAELLYYLITETKPILTVETGFDHGLVASIMTAAHMVNELNGGHVPVQGQPRYLHEGVGFFTIEKLNLVGYQIMEHEPAIVFPQLYLQKLNEGLALVYFNSAKDFDEQMMEYFYMNRLLNEGGIMVINTTNPARQELVDYIRKNRFDYAVRELDCGMALVQLPQPVALSQHTPRFRH